MIKKILLALSCFLLSFFVLEGLSRMSGADCEFVDGANEGNVEQKSLYCPYKYKPYKNVVYDFISKDITTKVAVASVAPAFVEVDDSDLHYEEGQAVVLEAPLDVVVVAEKPKIAIVIDDMGISKKRTDDIISLNAPLTLAFLTYANNLNKYFEELEGSEFEVMAHIPMEAKTKFDEAPDTLRVAHSDERVEKNFVKMLDRFEGIKFINNHTGSLFTENYEKMSLIMKELKKRDMAFLDSKTSGKSVGKKVAEKFGVKYLSRNVFLDNKNDFDYIMGQIKQTENIAKKHGYAIAIAHPKPQTYKALKHWIGIQKDFEIVNLRDLSF